MKTKLTLTLEKSTIEKAKRYSKRTGKSISRMVEEMFEQSDKLGADIKTTQQVANDRLLQRLEDSPSNEILDDKALRRAHVARKYS